MEAWFVDSTWCLHKRDSKALLAIASMTTLEPELFIIVIPSQLLKSSTHIGKILRIIVVFWTVRLSRQIIFCCKKNRKCIFLSLFIIFLLKTFHYRPYIPVTWLYFTIRHHITKKCQLSLPVNVFLITTWCLRGSCSDGTYRLSCTALSNTRLLPRNLLVRLMVVMLDPGTVSLKVMRLKLCNILIVKKWWKLSSTNLPTWIELAKT